MADGYQPYVTYRIADPIENLQLQVILRKRKTRVSAPVDGAAKRKGSPPRRARELERGAAAEETPLQDDPDDEGGEEGERRAAAPSADGAGDEARGGADEDVVEVARTTFRWQTKAFSPTEVKTIRRLLDDQSTGRSRVLSRLLGRAAESQVSTQMYKLLLAREREMEAAGQLDSYAGEILHTRIHSEGFFDEAEWSMRLTTSRDEQETPLAREVLSGTSLSAHRLGESASVSMWILAELPSKDLKKRGAQQDGSTFLSRWRGRRDRVVDNEATEAVVLCTLRLYSGGRLDVKPGLSTDPSEAPAAGARWFQLAGGRYEYKIENVAEAPASAAEGEENKSGRLTRKPAAAAAGRAVPGLDFQMPPRQSAYVYHHIEILKTSHFGDAAQYVQFYALAADGWTIRPSCVVNAVTQTSTVAGTQQVATFGFPIELMLESNGLPASARPPLTLFFSVMSVDLWDRHRHLGYAHFSPLAQSGSGVFEVAFWKVAESRGSAMQSFFVGGAEEMRDLRAIALPDGFASPCLNKYGLSTDSSGKMYLRVNTLLQQEQETGAGAKARARPVVAEKPPPAVRKQRAPYRAIKDAHTLGASSTAADLVRRRLEERTRAKLVPQAR
ncbi:hypothetical protein AB1Y20_008457 [Prymnesium parvum]|uniref:Meckel syndrome type 1 protein n=1 Tax=Prymnesium parvum TaxID=97485 RepID=A0AB34IT64_PRYPA